ncbi:chemotaxis protein CheB [Stenomitos frigidus]|uniref:protein-glutamate methylesterase n=1 Tax=Stenomitos frigidus ULC18 TaxID=2107698 RepID=A0A2T1DU33_9CYAN|nr:chemotaxis protein CheB [Stenomitos frigidus]PSB23982.1 chemotaxis protein CheB [Stenomitos frigidus ULC18]
MAFELVVIGTSLGGLSALKVLLGGLADPFPLAIAVVQHRHKESGHVMSEYMQQYTTLPVLEAEDKDELLPGHIYLAPADYHLLIEWGYLTLSVDEPVCFARPSIDVLFESAADAYADRAIGIILTGANRDGTNGLARIKACGGLTIVQDPATAETGMMPQAAIATTKVDAILPLPDIAPYLVNLLSRVRS